ncbi:NAC domain-containing protein 17-like isoform X1 [Camellia sinensis]|uniref:NAC domain-containing protein 17-like isoform X1 n=1 Tax=Camellia sinensis TaxID=4442 RepID=UPI0010357735|nr:NAC domain-containing protein 17-like isoform X1 [Camellia sinensis]
MKVSNDSSCFGDSQNWPPGFRFHPMDEELVLYYLKRKICRKRLKLDIIGETDVYKWDPEELPGISKLKTGDRQWYFFSPRDRKYPNGARSNRATRHGYWKATGKDRNITCNSRVVGLKKTLVFYKGRAPSGVRTDWVMHEYTLDEEELKRCQSARDYYALYKVYKKSGPGPKNGEQYGAPFREEDWAEDDDIDVNGHADQENSVVQQENSVKQVNDLASVDNTATNGQVQPPPNDLDEFMNRIADEPLPGQPLAAFCGYVLQEVFGEEETQSTLVNQSFGEANLNERSMSLHTCGEKNDVQPGFDLTQTATSHLLLHETSEVTSAPNIHRHEPHDTEEDFQDDFLEMDDLTGPEPTIQPVAVQFDELDGLCELDLYQDAVMFIRDACPMNLGPVSHSYFDNMGNEMVHPVSNPCLNNLENEGVNPASHLYLNNLGTEMMHPNSHLFCNNLDMANQLDFQLQHDPNDASQISNQMWNHNIVTPTESNQEAIPPPTSGVMYDVSSANFPAGVNQNQNQNQIVKEDEGGSTWLASLWAYVESIPATPASASENTALVNRAFERMSSFGRIGGKVKVNAGDTSLASGNPTATLRRSSSSWYNRRYYIFAVIGVLCAILWVWTGTSVGVLGRHISL